MAKTIRIVSEEPGVFYQYRPIVPVVVTSHANGRDNAMALGLHTLLANHPPICGISVDAKRFTYELIAESKEFGVNFLPFEEVELLLAVGSVTGREVDKFQRFNIAKDKSVRTAVPILKAAYVAYECKLIDERNYADHIWLVGDIVAVHWQKEAFNSENIRDLDKVKPILSLNINTFVTTSKDTIKCLDQEVYKH